MSAPLVSIVVPVYNTRAYLEECLASACAQTLRDIEIVCVNDGSTDGSDELLHRIAADDERIKVIDKENGGLSSARNAGLAAACGTYIMLLDSDDLLVPQACEAVVRRFDETHADIVTFGATCFPEEAASARLRACLSPRDALYRPFDERLLFDEESRPYACRSAFRREFLEACGLRFDESLRFGEDQPFYFSAYPQAGAVALMSDKLYRYRVSSAESLTGAVADDAARRVGLHIDVAICILEEWSARGWFERFGWRTLGWLVEFVALDLYGLPDAERAPLQERYGSALRAALAQVDLAATGLGPQTRALLRNLMGPADAPAPGRLAIYRFYLERRGLAQCAKRALEGLAERGRRG